MTTRSRPSAPAITARASDVILAVLVTAAIAFIIATTPTGPVDAGAYVFALGFGTLMLLRRRLPRTVLVLTALGTFAYYTLDYPQIGVAVPLAAALFSAAEVGLLVWPIATALVVWAVSTLFRIRDGVEPLGTLLGYESVSDLTLAAAAIAVGYTLRARRIGAAQRARIAELTDAQLRRETALRVRSERGRISRELHDSVGHTLSVVALQAAVAREAIDRDESGAAVAAIESIRSTSRASLVELRAMVRVLRESGDGVDHLVSLAALDDLAAAARSAGIHVETAITGRLDELSPSVDAAAYRVTQEALTNVIRHARAQSAHVSVSVAGTRVRVRVTDDGTGGGPQTRIGSGLEGMGERVRLLGGSLRAGPDGDGGFVVEADMPVRLDA